MTKAYAQTACVLTYYQAAEINLYEVSLSYAFSNEDDKAYRLSTLYSFLHSLKTFFCTHFTLAYPMTAARSFATSAQAEYAIRMGIKLVRIPSTDGWDSDHARSVLDFPSAMDLVAAKLEGIIRARSRGGQQSLSHDGRDIFAHYLNNMRCLKNWSQSLESSSGGLGEGSHAEHGRQDLESTDTALSAAHPQSFSDNLLAMTDSDNYLWEALNCQNDDWVAFGS